MRQAADAAGAVVELAGIGLRVGDQLGHRLHRQILLDDDRLHDRADDAHRRQVLHWIVSELLGKRRDRDGADAADAEGVAIRRRARDVLGPDDAAGAHAAFDNDRFSQRLFDVTGGQAADQVGVAPGAIGHDESDGPARPCILRVRPVRRPRHPQCQRQCSNMLHRVLLLALGARQASSLPLRKFMEPRSLGKRRHVARAGVATSRRGRCSPFRVELGADRVAAQALEIQENRIRKRSRVAPVETMSHGREKRSYGLSVCRAGVVRRGRSMLTLAEYCWPILSLASLEREGDR